MRLVKEQITMTKIMAMCSCGFMEICEMMVN
ncbi:hypothetical protein N3C_0454 [Clostridium sp. N3C]|nr:hypothetical protein N3C_0454 [Clostridium sp. N3C]